MNRWLALIGTLMLLVAVGCSRTIALAPATPSPEPTLVAPIALETLPESEAGTIMAQVAADDRLTTLARALGQAGLAPLLSGAEPYTLLAPTDAAFGALPDAARKALARPETLQRVLSQHVLVGQIAEIDLVTAGSVDTIAGVPLEVSLVVVEAVETCCGFDQALLINDIETRWANLDASNGKVYVIDRVIWPPDVPQS